MRRDVEHAVAEQRCRVRRQPQREWTGHPASRRRGSGSTSAGKVGGSERGSGARGRLSLPSGQRRAAGAGGGRVSSSKRQVAFQADETTAPPVPGRERAGEGCTGSGTRDVGRDRSKATQRIRSTRPAAPTRRRLGASMSIQSHVLFLSRPATISWLFASRENESTEQSASGDAGLRAGRGSGTAAECDACDGAALPAKPRLSRTKESRRMRRGAPRFRRLLRASSRCVERSLPSTRRSPLSSSYHTLVLSACDSLRSSSLPRSASSPPPSRARPAWPTSPRSKRARTPAGESRAGLTTRSIRR